MRIIECDRCHKRISNDAVKIGYISLDTQDVKTGDLDGKNEFEGWDLCDDCMDKIRDFMRPAVKAVKQEREPDRPGSNVPKQPTVPPMPIKPKASIKRPIADGTKYSAVTPEKIEQIKELAREGKLVKEISELVGVSDPTVRKYKREVDNEDADQIEKMFFGEVPENETDL